MAKQVYVAGVSTSSGGPLVSDRSTFLVFNSKLPHVGDVEVRDESVRVIMSGACLLFSFSLYRVSSLCPAGPCLHFAPRNLQPTNRQVGMPAGAGAFKPTRILATGNQFLAVTASLPFATIKNGGDRATAVFRRPRSQDGRPCAALIFVHKYVNQRNTTRREII